MNTKQKKHPSLPSSPEGAFSAAVSLLTYKENTEKELKRKLKERGFEEEDIDAAFEKLREKRFLDERRYFERFVRLAAESRRYGARRILNEAYVKGFSEETVRACAPLFKTIDFDALCYDTLCRLPQRNDEKKAAAALLRRGYTSSQVREAIRAMKESGDKD